MVERSNARRARMTRAPKPFLAASIWRVVSGLGHGPLRTERRVGQCLLGPADRRRGRESVNCADGVGIQATLGCLETRSKATAMVDVGTCSRRRAPGHSDNPGFTFVCMFGLSEAWVVARRFGHVVKLCFLHHLYRSPTDKSAHDDGSAPPCTLSKTICPMSNRPNASPSF